jgi:hypothetical protein
MIITVGVLSMLASPALAQSDASAINGYAESLPAADGPSYPAARKKKSTTVTPAPAATTPPAATTTTTPKAATTTTPKAATTAKNHKKAKVVAAHVAGDDPARARAEDLLDRVSKDPALGAPTITVSAAKKSSDKSLVSAVLSPGSVVFWLILALVALTAVAVHSRKSIFSRNRI